MQLLIWNVGFSLEIFVELEVAEEFLILNIQSNTGATTHEEFHRGAGREWVREWNISEKFHILPVHVLGN